MRFDLLSTVLSLLIFVFFWKLARKDEKTKLVNKLPGPFAFPLVGNIMEALEPRETLLKRVIERRHRFGLIFRLWLGGNAVVIISNPDDIEVVLKSTKHSEKSFGYEFLKPWLGTGLLTSKGAKWSAHRKLITPTFHFSILQNFVEVFQRNSTILVTKLQVKADTGEVFDMFPLVTLCALDIICETAMGTKVNAQSESQSPYVKAVYRLSSLIIHRVSRVWLHPDFLFKLTSTGKEFQQHLRTVQNFTDDVIRARKKSLQNAEPGYLENNQVKKLTFLDMLLKASMNEASTPLTDVELREEVETFMFEGHDTTAAAISWALLLLGHHSKIQEEVFDEVKAVYEKNNGEALTISDLSEMKLLERVIKETLRLFPSVVSIGRTIEEDIKLGGYLIPKGVMAFIGIYTVHRDSTHFKDPDVFDPDRFLPEASAARHPFAYIPFSAGPRNCIGTTSPMHAARQKFALLEEKVVLSNLIYNYKFESVEKIDEVVKVPELILRPLSGIKLRITKR
ncbi:hypothetical protein RUM44_005755 [Polyplax serrata]|uniref:Cytochrome P450 n=1 Tax=Polyplax serrata TaxID=468196 RepID=A0ABR1AW15_POLSC